MAEYEFECRKCKKVFTLFMRISERATAKIRCPGCGGENVLHTVLAVALSAAVIVHVYLAVVIHPHAVRAMLTGEVDEACVREDYPLSARPRSEERAA